MTTGLETSFKCLDRTDLELILNLPLGEYFNKENQGRLKKMMKKYSKNYKMILTNGEHGSIAI